MWGAVGWYKMEIKRPLFAQNVEFWCSVSKIMEYTRPLLMSDALSVVCDLQYQQWMFPRKERRPSGHPVVRLPSFLQVVQEYRVGKGLGRTLLTLLLAWQSCIPRPRKEDPGCVKKWCASVKDKCTITLFRRLFGDEDRRLEAPSCWREENS